jgi:hypothetical protein
MEITYIFTLGVDSFKEFQSFGMMFKGVNHIQDEWISWRKYGMDNIS